MSFMVGSVKEWRWVPVRRCAGTFFERSANVTRLKSYSKSLATSIKKLVCGLSALAVATALAGGVSAQERPNVNERGLAIKGFLDRANAYIELQKKEDNGLPKLQPRDDTSKLEVHQRALAARMRLARADAKPGSIFGSAAPYIREVVWKDAQARPAKDKKAILEEVPPKDPPKVNAEYPEKAALATVPPLMLDQLPRLPEGLEYRLMGRDLILRDTQTNLIADILNEGAAPVKQ
jgi:hypothetical protein